MAGKWIDTGADENGVHSYYYIDSGTGDVYTANPYTGQTYSGNWTPDQGGATKVGNMSDMVTIAPRGAEDFAPYKKFDWLNSTDSGFTQVANPYGENGASRYAYKSDSTSPPDIQDFINAASAAHQQTYGVPLNRNWTADAQISQTGQGIIDEYTKAVQEYNKLYGTNIQPSVTNISQLPTTEYQATGGRQAPGGLLSDMVSTGLGAIKDLGVNFVAPSAALAGAAYGLGGLVGGTTAGLGEGASAFANDLGGAIGEGSQAASTLGGAAGGGSSIADLGIGGGGTGGTTLADMLGDTSVQFGTPTVAPTGAGTLADALGTTGVNFGTGATGATSTMADLGMMGPTPIGGNIPATQTASFLDQVPTSLPPGGDQTPATTQLPATTPPAPPYTAPTDPTLNTITNAATGGTALSRILDGSATPADWAQILGSGAATLASTITGNNTANTLKDIYNQQQTMLKPTWDQYNAYMTNPNDFYNSAPAMGATDAVLRKLSVGGNPAANPGALSQAAAYNLGGYNQTMGRLSNTLSGQASNVNNAGTAYATGQDQGLTNLFGGISNLVNPRSTGGLTDLLAQWTRANTPT